MSEVREEPLLAYIRVLLGELNTERGTGNAESDKSSGSSASRNSGIPRSAFQEPLTAQEQRVLRMFAAGLSRQEIASELVVSVNTVKTHLRHVYRKLDVSNRRQARDAARQLSLL